MDLEDEGLEIAAVIVVAEAAASGVALAIVEGSVEVAGDSVAATVAMTGTGNECSSCCIGII